MMIYIHHHGLLVKNFSLIGIVMMDSFSGHDVEQPLRVELHSILLQFWKQWICITVIVLTWLVITFIPTFDNCPRGYVGPGGRHEHGKYQNCTGGKLIDVLLHSHIHLLYSIRYGWLCRSIDLRCQSPL